MADPYLTSHQEDVLTKIMGLTEAPGIASATAAGYVVSIPTVMIGSTGACRKLAEKGYLAEYETVGPRGAPKLSYWPTAQATGWIARRTARQGRAS